MANDSGIKQRYATVQDDWLVFPFTGDQSVHLFTWIHIDKLKRPCWPLASWLLCRPQHFRQFSVVAIGKSDPIKPVVDLIRDSRQSIREDPRSREKVTGILSAKAKKYAGVLISCVLITQQRLISLFFLFYRLGDKCKPQCVRQIRLALMRAYIKSDKGLQEQVM